MLLTTWSHRQLSKPGHFQILVTSLGPDPAVLVLLQPCLPHSSLSGSPILRSQQGDSAQIGWYSPGCVCRAEGSGSAQAQAAGVLDASPEGHGLWLVHIVLTCHG